MGVENEKVAKKFPIKESSGPGGVNVELILPKTIRTANTNSPYVLLNNNNKKKEDEIPSNN